MLVPDFLGIISAPAGCRGQLTYPRFAWLKEAQVNARYAVSGIVGLMLVAAVSLASLGCGGGTEEGGLRLLFYSNRDGDDDVYIMNLDGTDVQQLTDDPGRDYEADTSPHRSTLVFASQRSGGGGSRLHLMNADGTGIRQLTFGSSDEGRVIDDYAHFSHSGRRVVFQRVVLPEGGSPDADIWIVDVDSGEETQVTDTPDAWDSTPSFGADGLSVLFESNRDGDFDLYRLDLTTMEVVQLNDVDGRDVGVKESPDGRLFTFESDRDGDFEVYVMDSDGGNVRALTKNKDDDHYPHWSPDGAKLSFDSDRDGDREIYIMNADGSDQRRLTTNPARDVDPHWTGVR